MPRAAITGSSGHLGANMVRILLDKGYDVRALVRQDTRSLEGLPVERIQGGLLDVEALKETFTGADVVFHLAAIVALGADHEQIVWRTNVEGTRNVVEACIACGVKRLVHFSSIHAFSAHPVNEPVTESRALAEESHLPIYDRSKVGAEKEALKGLARGLEVVIVNPTAVIGPCDYKPSPMGRVLLELRSGHLPALVQGGFNWVDARDVCQAAEVASRIAPAGERYLLAGKHLPLMELARLASSVTGTPAPRFAVPMWLAYAGLPFAALASTITRKQAKFTRASLRALSHHQVISHEKAARELGYAPRPLDETIYETYAWFQENSYSV